VRSRSVAKRTGNRTGLGLIFSSWSHRIGWLHDVDEEVFALKIHSGMTIRPSGRVFLFQLFDWTVARTSQSRASFNGGFYLFSHHLKCRKLSKAAPKTLLTLPYPTKSLILNGR